MSDWLIDQATFIEAKREFKKLEGKVLMDSKGNLIAIDSWDVEKVEKTTKPLFGKERTNTFYKINNITFLDARDKKMYSWNQNSGFMCTEMGIGRLLEDRERFINVKKQLKTIGFNIVSLPKKKKKDEN